MPSYMGNEYTTPLPALGDVAWGAHRTGTNRRAAADIAQTLSTVLLATVLSVLIVAADRLVDAWSGGHLLVAVTVLWLVLVAGLATFARRTRWLALRVVGGLQGWSERAALERSDSEMLEIARRDPRVMADVRSALAAQTPLHATPRQIAKVYYRPW